MAGEQEVKPNEGNFPENPNKNNQSDADKAVIDQQQRSKTSFSIESLMKNRNDEEEPDEPAVSSKMVAQIMGSNQGEYSPKMTLVSDFLVIFFLIILSSKCLTDCR